jgi:hypothetical protein
MTGDKAVELINEWLNLAKEVGDMNLNRMEYDEEKYICRKDKAGIVYDRRAMKIVSKQLGHNRISVIASDYLHNV